MAPSPPRPDHDEAKEDDLEKDNVEKDADAPADTTDAPVKRGRGRPKGSKNKKTPAAPAGEASGSAPRKRGPSPQGMSRASALTRRPLIRPCSRKRRTMTRMPRATTAMTSPPRSGSVVVPPSPPSQPTRMQSPRRGVGHRRKLKNPRPMPQPSSPPRVLCQFSSIIPSPRFHTPRARPPSYLHYDLTIRPLCTLELFFFPPFLLLCDTPIPLAYSLVSYL
ncbi:hypothetical protein B0H16DRAFT_70206 [Mycena metata]|uniref:Uncharacterized protein n=1 Tax=Mycena metata TaxID=1033252 RepID=A0AAD7JYN2_9AGAR|nr:hypothetical protein B0H16DRAFT_70206 [Mycena metata]